MQTLICYYIKIAEFHYDMHILNQVTDSHIYCHKLIIQAAHPIEGNMLTFVCCLGNKLFHPQINRQSYLEPCASKIHVARLLSDVKLDKNESEYNRLENTSRNMYWRTNTVEQSNRKQLQWYHSINRLLTEH